MDSSRVRQCARIGVAGLLLAGCGAENKSSGFGFADESTASGGPPSTSDGNQSEAGSGSPTTTTAITTTTTGADTTGGESESTGTTCGDGARCVSAVPEDWMGPIAITRGPADESTAVPCGEAYPSGGLTLLEGYHDPDPTECDCNCAFDLATQCITGAYHFNSGCAGAHQAVKNQDGCNAVNIPGGTYFYMFTENEMPFCMREVIETVPEVPWDGRVASCTGAEQGAACPGGGVCTPMAPAGLDAGLCIFKQGEVACPPGDFSEQSILFNGAEDSRGCGTCICGTPPETPECTGTLEVFASNDCTGTPQAILTPVEPCEASTVGAMSTQINFDTDPTCPVMVMPEPVGEVAAGTAFTYCCEPA